MNFNKEQESIWRGRVYRYVPFILCVILIFLFSTGEGSMARTSLFVRPLLEFLFPGVGEETLMRYHGFVRKLAHLTEYALLALTAARAFKTSSQRLLSSHWPVLSLLAVITIAAIDETNQSLNPARTGSVFDVMIDLAGGVIGLALFLIFLAVWKRTRTDHKRAPDCKTL